MDLVPYRGKGLTVKCHFCESPAVAIFYMPEGCVCSLEQTQALCSHHAFKASPRAEMVLIEDLTEGEEFTDIWLHGRVFNETDRVELTVNELHVLAAIEELSRGVPPPRHREPEISGLASSDSDFNAD